MLTLDDFDFHLPPELIAQHPDVDAQHLRTLIRSARKEQEQGKPPKAYREIFQALKQMQGADNQTETDHESTETEES